MDLNARDVDDGDAGTEEMVWDGMWTTVGAYLKTTQGNLGDA